MNNDSTRARAADNAQQPPIDYGVMLGSIERILEHVYVQITQQREQSRHDLQEFQDRIDRLDEH